MLEGDPQTNLLSGGVQVLRSCFKELQHLITLGDIRGQLDQGLGERHAGKLSGREERSGCRKLRLHHDQPPPRLSDSVGLEWGPRTCNSSKFPGDAPLAGLGNTHTQNIHTHIYYRHTSTNNMYIFRQNHEL